VIELDQIVAEQFVLVIAAAWGLVTALLVGVSTVARHRRRSQERQRRMNDG
jgi:hypothetical protein